MSHRLQFQIGHKHLEMKQKSKWSSLVAQLLSVAGDHGSHPGGGEQNFIFRFWVVISWLLLTLKFIHDYAKWSIHELIHHVWLSIRLNNLIAGHKTNWTKKFTWYLFERKYSGDPNSEHSNNWNIWIPIF